MMNFVIISGCSGGGKSTLLSELRQRGYAVIEEPGRRIIREETYTGGRAMPWIDMAAFLRRAIDVAVDDHVNAQQECHKWVFFDRSLIDAAAALQELTGEPSLTTLYQSYRYHPCVFLAPPWLEIYTQDTERRHGWGAALSEFKRLQRVYPALGYESVLLPKVSVVERANFVLAVLAGH